MQGRPFTSSARFTAVVSFPAVEQCRPVANKNKNNYNINIGANHINDSFITKRQSAASSAQHTDSKAHPERRKTSSGQSATQTDSRCVATSVVYNKLVKDPRFLRCLFCKAESRWEITQLDDKHCKASAAVRDEHRTEHSPAQLSF